MAYEIHVQVHKNGKLELDVDPFEISVFRESKRVKLLFEVDTEIDSTYHSLIRRSYAINLFKRTRFVSYRLWLCH